MVAGYCQPKRLALVGILLLLTTFGLFGPASAQVMIVDTAQPDLVKKPAGEQAEILAEVVRGSATKPTCTNARASLEKSYNTGAGGWLVLCDEGRDFWVVMPGKPKTAATALPCILARAAGTECYANMRTVLPEYLEQCALPPALPDRAIRSCTVLIQSGRFDDKPAVIAAALINRAVAYAGYSQLELALADFDKAVALQPNDINSLFNRAVTLERLGRYDQALVDLDKFLAQKPNELNGLHERGFVYLKKGDHDRAISDFDRVLSINPGFDKAIRNRAAALKAKENVNSAQLQTGRQNAAAPANTTAAPSANREPASAASNRQAAYCMEASFGLLQQTTKLVAILRDSRGKGQALLGQPGLAKSDQAQIVAHMKRLDDDIAANEKNRAQREADLKVFMAYLQKSGLLGGKTNPELLAQTSGEVRKDQETIQSTYGACLRGCAAGDASCKNTCDDKANGSEASKRMNRCGTIVGNFKG